MHFYFTCLGSDSGPYELLQRCRSEGVTVRVWIRHCVGVRGVCDGVPIVFDRHMNIVLRDVTEQYVPFRTLANGGVSAKKRKKRKKSKTVRDDPSRDHVMPSLSDGGETMSASSSHVTSSSDHVTSSLSCQVMQHAVIRQWKQLFIRGDNIVMISSPMSS